VENDLGQMLLVSFRFKLSYFFSQIEKLFVSLLDIHLILGIIPATILLLVVVYYSFRVLLWIIPLFTIQEFIEGSWVNGSLSIMIWLLILGLVLFDNSKEQKNSDSSEIKNNEVNEGTQTGVSSGE
jgi:hypothetical protein